MSVRVETGLERMANGDESVVALVRGKRIGLVAHPASVTSRLEHARDVLMRNGAQIQVLFGPEHGFGGEAQDMIGVADARDVVSGAAIYSLYGATEDELSPRREWLDGLDAVVVDLQDVGSRYYTFVWTAALVLRAAAKAGVQTIILDRPNPLGGAIVEGAKQREGFRSFIGLYDVSVRHGMTIGEICTMVRMLEGIDEHALHVVEMRGWARTMLFEETSLPWILPSPNMPTVDTARVYPGGCVIEGTNLSEGRGTTRPFEIFGAPFLDGQALARSVEMEGVALRACTFEPTFQKHGRVTCGGVQVHVTDANALRSYELYLRLIASSFQLSNRAMHWRTEVYEFVKDRLAIDLLTGGAEFREAVEAGSGLEGVLAAERDGAKRFLVERAPWLLYQ